MLLLVLPLGTELLVFCAYGDKWIFKCKGPYFDVEDVTAFSGVTLGLAPVPRQNLGFWYIQAKYYGQGRCFHFLPPENFLKFCINVLVALYLCVQSQIPCFVSALDLHEMNTLLSSGHLTV